MWDVPDIITYSEWVSTIVADGGLLRVHVADNDAINWLDWTMMKALARKDDASYYTVMSGWYKHD